MLNIAKTIAYFILTIMAGALILALILTIRAILEVVEDPTQGTLLGLGFVLLFIAFVAYIIIGWFRALRSA